MSASAVTKIFKHIPDTLLLSKDLAITFVSLHDNFCTVVHNTVVYHFLYCIVALCIDNVLTGYNIRNPCKNSI